MAGWPQSLTTTVSICLASDLPICVIWGRGREQLYNDAYRLICGDKPPRSMAQNFAECWEEAWPVIGEAHDAALAGDKAFLETQHIVLERHRFLEECFFTFFFSPIRDQIGQVGGLFHPVIAMTPQMLAQRRARALGDLTARTSEAKSVTDVLALSMQTLAEYEPDLLRLAGLRRDHCRRQRQCLRERASARQAMAELNRAKRALSPTSAINYACR